MIEARREQRGGASVVLRRAHDDDDIGLAPFIAAGLVPDAVRGIATDRGGGHEPEEDDTNEGPTRTGGAQRPWHFLYLAPEPHQHGSLRPIRAPVGV